jgi:hypothetical protein
MARPCPLRAATAGVLAARGAALVGEHETKVLEIGR